MNIIKSSLLVLSIGLSAFSSAAQTQDLSLEDAILKRWSDFAPENLKALQWVEGSKLYSYTSGKEIVISNFKSEIKRIKASDINEALKRVPSIHWIDSDNFRYAHNAEMYRYNISSGKSEKILTYFKDGQNKEYNDAAQAMAYTVDNNLFISAPNKNHVVSTSNDPAVVNGQAVHRYEFGIGKGTFWSPKGNMLAFYRKDESMVTDYPLVNVDTRIATAEPVKYPMAGMKSHHVTLGVYDLKSEKTIFINTGEPAEQYLTNICWSPDEKHVYIAVLNRDQNHMKLNAYNSSTGAFEKTLFEEKAETYVQPMHPMLFIEGKSNEFLWRSERDGYDHFYRYNTEGKLLNQVTKGNWVVKNFIGFSGSNIIFSGTADKALETHIYSSSIKNSSSKDIASADGMHNAKLSTDGRYIIDSYASIEEAKKINILTSKGKLVKKLLESKDPMADVKIRKAELGSIKAADGTTDLNTRMIKPFNFDPSKKYPVLVYVYNGPGVQMVYNNWLASAPLWMYHMANEGYIVFTVDGRGSENRGRDFEQATFRNLGVEEMKDQIKGVDYLRSLNYVQKDRIAVHGWSYGGFMTTNLMTTYPDVFTCGAAGGPVIDWKYYEVMYTERFMDTPQTNPEGYAAANMLNKAKDLKGDLLMIHGTVDDVVVWQHSLAFVKQCVDDGVQLDYFPYPGHPHNVRGKDRVHLMRKIINYIMKNNE